MPKPPSRDFVGRLLSHEGVLEEPVTLVHATGWSAIILNREDNSVLKIARDHAGRRQLTQEVTVLRQLCADGFPVPQCISIWTDDAGLVTAARLALVAGEAATSAVLSRMHAHARAHFFEELDKLLLRLRVLYGGDKRSGGAPNVSLVHGDLKGEHVFVDVITGAITAVIDWGASHCGDPDYDLTYISEWHAHMPSLRKLNASARAQLEAKLQQFRDRERLGRDRSGNEQQQYGLRLEPCDTFTQTTMSADREPRALDPVTRYLDGIARMQPAASRVQRGQASVSPSDVLSDPPPDPYPYPYPYPNSEATG